MEDALKRFKDSGYNIDLNPEYHFFSTEILTEISKLGVTILRLDVDYQAYDAWYNKVNYVKNYPKYVAQYRIDDTLPRKSFQHYLSIDVLKIQAKHTVLDVGGSTSVFTDIIKHQLGVKNAFRQDLSYNAGKHGDLIGGDAGEMDLPNASIDKIVLHCAWEHFEGDSDISFIREADRILKPNGQICIIPLYLADQYIIYTSPSVWCTKYAKIPSPPVLDRAAVIGVEETKKQRCERYFDVKNLYSRVIAQFGKLFDFQIVYFNNHADRKGCVTMALMATKV